MQLDKSYASITLAAMAMHRGFDEHCSVFISPNHMQEVSRKALILGQVRTYRRELCEMRRQGCFQYLMSCLLTRFICGRP